MITGIADVYGGDGAWDLNIAKQAGIVALIHKATEGMTYKDSVFAHGMRCAAMVGMLRGAYHFGRPGDGAKQADEFLKIVSPFGNDILLCLDLEGDLASPKTMKTEEAQAFLEQVRAVTGRWPLLYGGQSKTKERMRLAKASTKEVFSRCPLWLAKYGEEPVAPDPWDECGWSLWQFSDGKPDYGPRDQTAFPRSTPGFHRCDRSAFKGSVEELKTFWETAGRL